jgi:hypothetical protein
VLFTPVKRSDVCIERAFRDAPEIPERAGKMMDRVMGGKGRGLEFGFENRRDALGSRKRGTKMFVDDAAEDGEGEGDLYDQLGWNDDLDL